MTIFDKISDTLQQIEDTREKLLVLEYNATAPKSGKITGMPRDGSGGVNPIEMYLEKKEKIEGVLAILRERLREKWEIARRMMNAAHIDKQTQKMMYYRFYKGMQWKRCAEKLDKKYPDCGWNENKCFRKYREVLTKTGKFNHRGIV